MLRALNAKRNPAPLGWQWSHRTGLAGVAQIGRRL